MLSSPPRIDSRTESDIVRLVSEQAARLTVELVPASVAVLNGRTLDQDVVTAAGVMIASAGTVINADLATRISTQVGEGLIRVRGWQAPTGSQNDAGMALIRIFGHFAALVLERINRVPEKHFLAFLELIGGHL